MSKLLIGAVLVCCLVPVGGYAADTASAEQALTKFYAFGLEVLTNFNTANVSRENKDGRPVLSIEADARVAFFPLTTAAGRVVGTNRFATPTRTGFTIILLHETNKNAVRGDREDDRGDYVQYFKKFILRQEGESCEAIFVHYDRGKELPQQWVDRVSKFLDELSALDIKNKKA